MQETTILEKTTPYMLRNDGALLKCGENHPYIKAYYNMDYTTNLAELIRHPHWINWYSENSQHPDIRNMLDILQKNPTEELYNEINKILNNEFCKVRTSNIKYKYGTDNGEIYFRLCSTNINWFDLIWNTVLKFENQLKYITIVKDFQTFGKQFEYVKYKNIVFNKLPIAEFLVLKGNPVIENLDTEKIYLAEE